MRKRGGRTGPHQDINSSAASGMWDLTTHQQTKGAGSWVLPSTPPQFAPTNLALVSKTQTTATVSFTPPPDANPPITNYKYYVWSSGGGPVEGELSPVDITSPITVTGLTHTTSYTLYIAAVNSLGVGPWSSSLSFFTDWNNALLSVFMCGGGGSGGTYGGGGGGGNWVELTTANAQFITPGVTYSVVVGAGSSGTAIEVNASTGGASSAFGQVAYGGGDGGRYNNRGAGGGTNNGGSGAYIQSKSNGGSLPPLNTSWVGQTSGYRGGAFHMGGAYGSGGGAGSAWDGEDAQTPPQNWGWMTNGGKGGDGKSFYNPVIGSFWFGGGGGGSVFAGGTSYSGTAGAGGYGGGGGGGGGYTSSYGGWGNTAYGGFGQSEANGGRGGNGGPNSGGGGGGTSYLPSNGSTPGGNGGSGIVIITTPPSAPLATVTGNPTVSDTFYSKNYIFYSSGSIRW